MQPPFIDLGRVSTRSCKLIPLELTRACVQSLTTVFQVIYIHKNVPGVLRKVNEVLMNHNVDKQITDSRGEVAYLMADVSDIQLSDLKEIHEGLNGLSCKSRRVHEMGSCRLFLLTNFR